MKKTVSILEDDFTKEELGNFKSVTEIQIAIDNSENFELIEIKIDLGFEPDYLIVSKRGYRLFSKINTPDKVDLDNLILPCDFYELLSFDENVKLL